MKRKIFSVLEAVGLGILVLIGAMILIPLFLVFASYFGPFQ